VVRKTRASGLGAFHNKTVAHFASQSACPLYPRKQTCAAQKAMSALGQKQTYAVQKGMSAYPPKSGHVRCNWGCPLRACSGWSAATRRPCSLVGSSGTGNWMAPGGVFAVCAKAGAATARDFAAKRNVRRSAKLARGNIPSLQSQSISCAERRATWRASACTMYGTAICRSFELSFQRVKRLLEREKKPEYFKTPVPSRQFASQW
jgi:hypothetical protein